MDVSIALRGLLRRAKMVKRLHTWLSQKSRTYLRWTTWTSPPREWVSILRLVRRKGLRWAWQTEAALKFADDRLPYTPFSLKASSFRALSGVINPEITHVLEFGSGNSTLALWYLLRKVTSQPFTIVTFENDPGYYAKQRAWFEQGESITAVYAPLKRLTKNEETILAASGGRASKLYNQLGVIENILTNDQFGCLGTDQMFYAYDFQSLVDTRFDLVTLDGPNGPGRWYAYPLLQSICHYPFILFVDDFPLYAELNQIDLFLSTRLLDRGGYGEYGYAIYQVNAAAGADRLTA